MDLDPTEIFYDLKLKSDNSTETSNSTSLEMAGANHSVDFVLEDIQWTWDRTLLSIILGLIVIGTILGNLLVLSVFFQRPRELRLPSHFFIANLALADFLVSVLCLPFTAIMQVSKRWYFGEAAYTLWTIGHLWFCSSSILSICAVSFERYIGVKYPLDHSNIMSRPRLYLIITLVWIISGGLTFLAVFGWYEKACDEEQLKCKQNLQLGHVLVVVIGMMYIPVAIMSLLYLSIYKTATVHMKQLKAQCRTSYVSAIAKKSSDNRLSITSLTLNTELSNLDVEESELGVSDNGTLTKPPKENKESVSRRKIRDNSSRNQINLAKRLFILVGIVIVCYFPYNTILLVRTVSTKPIPNLSIYYDFFKWVRYLNSFANPIIYALAMPAYSLAIRNTLIRFRGKLFPYTG